MADPHAPPPLRQIVPALEAPVIEVVDIGAMQEDEARYAGLLETGWARLTGFEPNQEECRKLEATVPGARFLPYFLGDGGPGVFRSTFYPGCASLYEPNGNIIDRFSGISTENHGPEGGIGNFYVTGKTQVATRRLDDVSECPKPDWLKLDIQGAELDVMRNGTRTLAHALVVEVEVEFVEIYEGQPLFGAVHEFLSGQGFAFHKLIDLGGRTFRPVTMPQMPRRPMSQLLWADAVFVRSLFHPDALDAQALLKAAVILHEGYRSFDLVHALLMEHDRREGTRLVPPYQEFLQSASWQNCLLSNFKG